MRVSPMAVICQPGCDLYSNTVTVVGYYQNIADRRVVSSVKPGYLRELVPSKPPVEAEQWKDIQKDVEAKIMPGITH